jgi:acyltransferase
MKTDRINWIDQAKGIGILLVVLGHMNIPMNLSVFIFSFHMPLFFFISGFLFNENKYANNLKQILLSKIKTLLWPFLTFTFLGLVFLVFSKNYSEITNFNWSDFILGNKSINAPLWFLTALFSAEIVFSQIIRICKTKIVPIIVIVLLFGTLGFINIYTKNLSFFLNIHVALIAQLFFSLGWILKKYNLTKKIQNTIQLLIASVLLFLTLVTTSLNNSRLDMIENNYGNLFLTFTSAILGIFLIVILSKLILKINFTNKIFEYLGKNSLVILGTHVIIAPFIVSLFGAVPYRLDRVLTILAIYLSIEFFNRFFPIFTRLKLTKQMK